MHRFFGYSLAEWVEILTIISIVGGALLWCLNLAIKNGTEKLSESVQKLIQSSASRTEDRVDSLEDKFEQHIGEAKVRNTRITNLEKEVFRNKR